MLLLQHQYNAMRMTPGWLHFYSMVEGLKTMVENDLLRGKYDHDTHRALQATYGTILAIMAIPEQVANGEKILDEMLKATAAPGEQPETGAKDPEATGFFFGSSEADEKKIQAVVNLFDNDVDPLDFSAYRR